MNTSTIYQYIGIEWVYNNTCTGAKKSSYSLVFLTSFAIPFHSFRLFLLWFLLLLRLVPIHMEMKWVRVCLYECVSLSCSISVIFMFVGVDSYETIFYYYIFIIIKPSGRQVKINEWVNGEKYGKAFFFCVNIAYNIMQIAFEFIDS